LLLRLCYLAVDPCRFRGKFIHRTSSNSSSPSIDSSIGFILYVTFCIFHSIVVSPTSPQRGDSFSDPSSLVSNVRLHPLHRVPKSSIDSSFGYSNATSASSTVSSSPLQVLKGGITSPIHVSSLVLQPRLHPLHRIKFIKLFLESSIGQSSLSPSLPCHLVLKGGIVSDSPIHAFILDLSPKHFVRFIFVCRPPTIIDVQDIRSRDSTLVFKALPRSFFFQASSSDCLITLPQDSRLTVITAFFSQFLLSVGIPARIGLCDVGTPSLKGGIEGY
jgi:hypothetical protein